MNTEKRRGRRSTGREVVTSRDGKTEGELVGIIPNPTGRFLMIFLFYSDYIKI